MTHHYNPNLAASVTTTGQQILMSMIKQLTPTSLAQSIVGVQPIKGNVGSIFTMRHSYTTQPKYKFSRAKWYVAEFNVADYTDVVHWCREQFGPHPRNPDAWSRWEHRYENKIHFRDKEDYIMFVLRWGV
jgi:hypothetical protein